MLRVMRVFVFLVVRVARMLVRVRVSVFLMTFMTVPVIVVVLVVVGVMRMTVFVLVVAGHMDIELHSLDIRLLLPRGMQVVFVEPELGQFVFEPLEIDSQVNHCAQEHVAADAAECVQVKRFHGDSIPSFALGCGFRRVAFRGQGVDLARRVTGAESVVDIYNGHSRAATVEHA